MASFISIMSVQFGFTDDRTLDILKKLFESVSVLEDSLNFEKNKKTKMNFIFVRASSNPLSL